MTGSITPPRPRRLSLLLGTSLAIAAGLLVALAEQEQRLLPLARPQQMTASEFEQRIFAALSQPGFLDRAMQAAGLAREREKARAWRDLLAAEPALLARSGPLTIASGPVRARRSALVFLDYNCPHCRRLEQELARLRARDPDIRIIAMPVALLRPSSGTAARSVVAAAGLGKGNALHAALLAREGDADDDAVREAAQSIGLDWAALLQARDGDEVTSELARIAALAKRLAVQGTPASYLSSGDVIGGAATADRFLAAWAQR